MELGCYCKYTPLPCEQLFPIILMPQALRPGDVPAPSQEELRDQFNSMDPLRIKQLELQDPRLSADIARAIHTISDDHSLVRLRSVISDVKAGKIPTSLLGQMRDDLAEIEQSEEVAEPDLKLVG